MPGLFGAPPMKQRAKLLKSGARVVGATPQPRARDRMEGRMHPVLVCHAAGRGSQTYKTPLNVPPDSGMAFPPHDLPEVQAS